MRQPPRIVIRLLPAILLATAPSLLSAQGAQLFPTPQPGRYTPLDQREVPGKVARWNLIAKPSLYGHFQPIQIRLPSQGLVSFYSPEHAQPVLTQAPAQAAMLIRPRRLRSATLRSAIHLK